MKRLCLLFLFFTIVTTAMESIQIYESEEHTLQRKSKSLSPLSMLVEEASFKATNEFTVGEFVIIRNGMLALHNLKLSSDAKIVQIIDKKRDEYTFTLIKKKNEDGMPIIYSEISVKNPEILGKIPQAHIPEMLKN